MEVSMERDDLKRCVGYLTLAIVAGSLGWRAGEEWAWVGVLLWLVAGAWLTGAIAAGWEHVRASWHQEQERRLFREAITPEVEKYRALADLARANTNMIEVVNKVSEKRLYVLLMSAPYLFEIEPTGLEEVGGFSLYDAKIVMEMCTEEYGVTYLPLQHGLPECRARRLIRSVTDELIGMKLAYKKNDNDRPRLLVSKEEALAKLAERVAVEI